MNTRRAFIGNLLAASAGALIPGCSNLDPDRSGTSPAKRGLRVDAHCHIFNGEDLDAYGYTFGQGVKPESFVDTIAWPLRMLEKGVTSLVKFRAPGLHRELALLNNLLDRREQYWKETGKVPGRRELLDRLERDILEIAGVSRAESQLGKREERERAREITPSPAQLEKRAAAREERARIVREREDATFSGLKHPSITLRMTEPNDWLLGFLNATMNYRILNAVNLLRRYPDVDVFVPASLDFDAWFQGGPHGNDENPSEPLYKQAEIMGKITVLTEGRILSRTGYCPLRQAKWEKKVPGEYFEGNPEYHIEAIEPMKVLEDSIEAWGSVGAKLYPVLGFRALGNARLPNRLYHRFRPEMFGSAHPPLSPDGTELGERLDAAMHKLFASSRAHRTTVMAHTNHSHGPNSETMERTGPENWVEALEAYKDVGVDLAHFGGFGSGLDSSGGWPLRICELFARYPRLYTDISCVAGAESPKRRQDMEYVMTQFKEARSRIMYGSDWHEVLPELGSYGYYGHWTRLFDQSPALRPHARRFLGGNAVEFLGLRHGGAARERLANGLFKKYHVKPEWFRLADAMPSALEA